MTATVLLARAQSICPATRLTLARAFLIAFCSLADSCPHLPCVMCADHSSTAYNYCRKPDAVQTGQPVYKMIIARVLLGNQTLGTCSLQLLLHELRSKMLSALQCGG